MDCERQHARQAISHNAGFVHMAGEILEAMWFHAIQRVVVSGTNSRIRWAISSSSSPL